MKKYVQITAGRGPVECARAVTLVAKELIKSIPGLQLIDYEAHNQVEDCYMSMVLKLLMIFHQLFLNGKVPYFGVPPRIHIAPPINVPTGL